MALNSPTPGPGWIFETAIKGVMGKRPLGDPFSPGQRTFGPFFGRVAEAIAVRDAPPIAPPIAPPAAEVPPLAQPVPSQPAAPAAPPARYEPPPARAPRVDPVEDPVSAFAPSPGFPGYVPPTVLPETLPQVVTRTLPAVIGRVLGNVGMIFWPSRTADDDTWGDWWPEEKVLPKGPPKRPRIREPQPYGWPLPDFQGKWRRRPRVPGVLYPDSTEPYVDRPMPTGDPWPVPGTRPAARPSPQPRTPGFPSPMPTPTPTAQPLPDPIPFLLPYLFPYMDPRITNRPDRVARPDLRPRLPDAPQPGIRPGAPTQLPDNPFGPDPLTPSEPRGVDSPLPFASPQPYRADPCNCAAQDSKRKRKKDSCTNPISSKRTFTRNGAKFRTITRRIKCRV